MYRHTLTDRHELIRHEPWCDYNISRHSIANVPHFRIFLERDDDECYLHILVDPCVSLLKHVAWTDFLCKIVFFLCLMTSWSFFCCFCVIFFFCPLCHYVDWCCTEVILFWIIWVFRHELTHTKKADYEKTKCRIMLRLICAVSFMFWSLLPFFPLILMNSICKMLVFWTRNAFSSILVRHCVGRHSVKSHSCFCFFVRTGSRVALLSTVNLNWSSLLCWSLGLLYILLYHFLSLHIYWPV